jgi:hypothetical protein
MQRLIDYTTLLGLPNKPSNNEDTAGESFIFLPLDLAGLGGADGVEAVTTTGPDLELYDTGPNPGIIKTFCPFNGFGKVGAFIFLGFLYCRAGVAASFTSCPVVLFPVERMQLYS